MKKIAVSLLFLWLQTTSYAQSTAERDSLNLVSFNQEIDNNVVKQNIAGLEKAYADDFVFSHGSGRVDGKASWLKSVAKGGFMQRNHDSVKVELHGPVAIVRGKLSVQKNNKEKVVRYWVKYVRVFKKDRNEWQMISHITTEEYYLPG